MSETPLPIGKLSAEFLAELLAELDTADSSVVLPPGVGRDVAVLDVGAEDYLVVTCDPITFATDALGYYTVCVNINDIATSGGTPRWMLTTLLLPAGDTDDALVRDIWRQLRQTAAQWDVLLVGGHTEVTGTVQVPVTCGMMIGTVPRGKQIAACGVQEGDEIVLLGEAPIEGTALLSRELGERLNEEGFSNEEIQQAADLLFDPGICVMDYARLATETCTDIHAMHDPTEGGVATGLWEMATASEVGLRVEAEAIALVPLGERFCTALGIDPLGLIASGCLLVAVPQAESDKLVAAAAKADISAAIIATALSASAGLTIATAGQTHPLPRYDQDELTRVGR